MHTDLDGESKEKRRRGGGEYHKGGRVRGDGVKVQKWVSFLTVLASSSWSSIICFRGMSFVGSSFRWSLLLVFVPYLELLDLLDLPEEDLLPVDGLDRLAALGCRSSVCSGSKSPLRSSSSSLPMRDFRLSSSESRAPVAAELAPAAAPPPPPPPLRRVPAAVPPREPPPERRPLARDKPEALEEAAAEVAEAATAAAAAAAAAAAEELMVEVRLGVARVLADDRLDEGELVLPFA